MQLYIYDSLSIQQNHLQPSPILWEYPFKIFKVVWLLQSTIKILQFTD
jgi:hypothetical protein